MDLKQGDDLEDDEALVSEEDDEDPEVSAEMELRDDTMEIAHQLGILDAKMKTVTPELSATAQEKLDLRQLTKGMTKLGKAAKLQQAGLALIQGVLARNPSLAPLASVLRPYQSVEVNLSPFASSQPMPESASGKPQVFQVGPINEPVRAPNGVDWACRYCGKEMVSYYGAEAHTRREHTKVFFGPCPKCNFKTASSGSYRDHLKYCRK